MSYIPPLDTESKQRPKLARVLDATEIRVLGSLMEKQLSTPEYYPMTLNALISACNQKSNREPVMELSDAEVQRALERLQDEKLVWKVMGGRAVRYDHNLDHVWHINRREKALIAELLLRGAQTVGELRGRSERLEPFATVNEVEDLLRDMASQSEPLVVELPRRPGQKEPRWAHLAGGTPAEPQYEPEAAAEPRGSGEPVSMRVARLEQQVATLTEKLTRLLDKLGE